VANVAAAQGHSPSVAGGLRFGSLSALVVFVVSTHDLYPFAGEYFAANTTFAAGHLFSSGFGQGATCKSDYEQLLSLSNRRQRSSFKIAIA